MTIPADDFSLPPWNFVCCYGSFSGHCFFDCLQAATHLLHHGQQAILSWLYSCTSEFFLPYFRVESCIVSKPCTEANSFATCPPSSPLMPCFTANCVHTIFCLLLSASFRSSKTCCVFHSTYLKSSEWVVFNLRFFNLRLVHQKTVLFFLDCNWQLTQSLLIVYRGR